MFLLRRFYLSVVLLSIFILITGMMPLWSQSNEPSLNGSENTSATWNELFRQGQAIYETQKNDLGALKQEIWSSRTGYNELTSLSERLLRSNEDLNRYNSQIAERMQERDEDLAFAYEENNDLKISNLKKDKTIFKLVLTVIAMGVVILGAMVFAVIRLYVKIKKPVKL